jgi:hypothetical protein
LKVILIWNTMLIIKLHDFNLYYILSLKFVYKCKKKKTPITQEMYNNKLKF